MASGDEATNNLRRQIQQLTQDFDAFKVTSKREFTEMQDQLGAKHKREMEQLKEKYEQMLQELRMNANSDKEFL